MPSAKKPGASTRSAGRQKTSTAAKKPARGTAAPKSAVAEAAESAAHAPRVDGAPKPQGRARRMGGPTITIVQYVSGIACPVRQKRVLRSLGLRHPHHRVVRPDNPAVRGMVAAIPHLVRIEEGGHGA